MILEFDDYYDELDRKKKEYLKEVDEALDTFINNPIDIWQNITDIVDPFKDSFNFLFKLDCLISETSRPSDGYYLINQEYKQDIIFALYNRHQGLLNILKNKSKRRLYFKLGFLNKDENNHLFDNVVKPVMERIESEYDIRISNGDPFNTLKWTYVNNRTIDIEII